MLTKDFYFDLPEELIAQKPSEKRGEDRLMILKKETGEILHKTMNDLPDFIAPETLMIFNDSKVRKSRCFGTKIDTGKIQEFMFLTNLSSDLTRWHVMVRGAKKVRAGNRYTFSDGSVGEIEELNEDAGTEFRSIRFQNPLKENWFKKNGHVPLPPYIKRADEKNDDERYQTVYAREVGSSACPTAGLHFTKEMLSRLSARGIECAYVTLHVGLGTFLPVRAEKIEEHKMHREIYSINEACAKKIENAKNAGRPILAVGTTSVRTLESAAFFDKNSGIYKVQAGVGETSIFMYPGYKFKIVDKLFTNFHTPESTLIMLVSAFAGREHILNAYQTAVHEKYRFFSYGDAMLIL